MPVRRVSFQSETHALAGILDLPADPPRFIALFAHCFTCTKDIKAIARISRFLSQQNVAVLRFDFRGLGGSKGVFADSNFLTNLADIRAATQFLTQELGAPQILIGHSLGGAAMMAIASEIKSATGLVTLAAPSDTSHLVHTLLRLNPDITNHGEGDVVIGGMTHRIKQQMLDVLDQYDLPAKIKSLNLPHLIVHSAADETVLLQHAQNIFQWTGGPKTIITPGESDHLFVDNPKDVAMLAGFIESWLSALEA